MVLPLRKSMKTLIYLFCIGLITVSVHQLLTSGQTITRRSCRDAPVKTSCPVTLRTAMWEQHSLQPAAKTYLGAGIKEILHYSSYNCRQIRGSNNRWSTHATGEAIDIAGFVLTDGRKITLLKDWEKEQDFFDAIRQGACQWFKTVLGPDYNSLHRDHFHLQSVGRGTCR